MAMTAAIPVLAFTAHDRDPALAGALLALWGGGAMLGSLLAIRLVRTASLHRLGALAWAGQALPLWALVASRSPLVAAVALGASGLANGVRVPPISALTLQRVPPRICAETMTVASSVILGTGFVGLLAAGLALEHADPALAVDRDRRAADRRGGALRALGALSRIRRTRAIMARRMKRLLILGATGSIGLQALDVVARAGDEFELIGLSAERSHERLVALAEEHGVDRIALGDADAAARAAEAWTEGEVLAGPEGLVRLVAESGADLVLNAIVGSAGLGPTVVALTEGIDVALANKESLVVGGDLVMPLAEATGAQLIPVDSEHSALHQLIAGEPPGAVDRLVITASGGPFRGRSRAELEDVSVEDALQHPTWAMGGKITIDSATLMNKGLEVIEAHHLFGTPYDQHRRRRAPAVDHPRDGPAVRRRVARPPRPPRHAGADRLRAAPPRARRRAGAARSTSPRWAR